MKARVTASPLTILLLGMLVAPVGLADEPAQAPVSPPPEIRPFAFVDADPVPGCADTYLGCSSELLREDPGFYQSPKRVVSTGLKQGPPEWAPPQLTYWDTSTGDWRLSQSRWEDDSYNITSSDLIMLGFQFQPSGDGLEFNASLDARYWYNVFNPPQP